MNDTTRLKLKIKLSRSSDLSKDYVCESAADAGCGDMPSVSVLQDRCENRPSASSCEHCPGPGDLFIKTETVGGEKTGSVAYSVYPIQQHEHLLRMSENKRQFDDDNISIQHQKHTISGTLETVLQSDSNLEHSENSHVKYDVGLFKKCTGFSSSQNDEPDRARTLTVGRPRKEAQAATDSQAACQEIEIAENRLNRALTLKEAAGNNTCFESDAVVSEKVDSRACGSTDGNSAITYGPNSTNSQHKENPLFPWSVSESQVSQSRLGENCLHDWASGTVNYKHIDLNDGQARTSPCVQPSRAGQHVATSAVKTEHCDSPIKRVFVVDFRSRGSTGFGCEINNNISACVSAGSYPTGKAHEAVQQTGAQEAPHIYPVSGPWRADSLLRHERVKSQSWYPAPSAGACDEAKGPAPHTQGRAVRPLRPIASDADTPAGSMQGLKTDLAHTESTAQLDKVSLSAANRNSEDHVAGGACAQSSSQMSDVLCTLFKQNPQAGHQGTCSNPNSSSMKSVKVSSVLGMSLSTPTAKSREPVDRDLLRKLVEHKDKAPNALREKLMLPAQHERHFSALHEKHPPAQCEKCPAQHEKRPPAQHEKHPPAQHEKHPCVQREKHPPVQREKYLPAQHEKHPPAQRETHPLAQCEKHPATQQGSSVTVSGSVSNTTHCDLQSGDESSAQLTPVCPALRPLPAASALQLTHTIAELKKRVSGGVLSGSVDGVSCDQDLVEEHSDAGSGRTPPGGHGKGRRSNVGWCMCKNRWLSVDCIYTETSKVQVVCNCGKRQKKARKKTGGDPLHLKSSLQNDNWCKCNKPQTSSLQDGEEAQEQVCHNCLKLVRMNRKNRGVKWCHCHTPMLDLPNAGLETEGIPSGDLYTCRKCLKQVSQDREQYAISCSAVSMLNSNRTVPHMRPGTAMTDHTYSQSPFSQKLSESGQMQDASESPERPDAENQSGLHLNDLNKELRQGKSLVYVFPPHPNEASRKNVYQPFDRLTKPHVHSKRNWLCTETGLEKCGTVSLTNSSVLGNVAKPLRLQAEHLTELSTDSVPGSPGTPFLESTAVSHVKNVVRQAEPVTKHRSETLGAGAPPRRHVSVGEERLQSCYVVLERVSSDRLRARGQGTPSCSLSCRQLSLSRLCQRGKLLFCQHGLHNQLAVGGEIASEGQQGFREALLVNEDQHGVEAQCPSDQSRCQLGEQREKRIACWNRSKTKDSVCRNVSKRTCEENESKEVRENQQNCSKKSEGEGFLKVSSNAIRVRIKQGHVQILDTDDLATKVNSPMASSSCAATQEMDSSDDTESVRETSTGTLLQTETEGGEARNKTCELQGSVMSNTTNSPENNEEDRNWIKMSQFNVKYYVFRGSSRAFIVPLIKRSRGIMVASLDEEDLSYVKLAINDMLKEPDSCGRLLTYPACLQYKGPGGGEAESCSKSFVAPTLGAEDLDIEGLRSLITARDFSRLVPKSSKISKTKYLQEIGEKVHMYLTRGLEEPPDWIKDVAKSIANKSKKRGRSKTKKRLRPSKNVQIEIDYAQEEELVDVGVESTAGVNEQSAARCGDTSQLDDSIGAVYEGVDQTDMFENQHLPQQTGSYVCEEVFTQEEKKPLLTDLINSVQTSSACVEGTSVVPGQQVMIPLPQEYCQEGDTASSLVLAAATQASAVGGHEPVTDPERKPLLGVEADSHTGQGDSSEQCDSPHQAPVLPTVTVSVSTHSSISHLPGGEDCPERKPLLGEVLVNAADSSMALPSHEQHSGLEQWQGQCGGQELQSQQHPLQTSWPLVQVKEEAVDEEYSHAWSGHAESYGGGQGVQPQAFHFISNSTFGRGTVELEDHEEGSQAVDAKDADCQHAGSLQSDFIPEERKGGLPVITCVTSGHAAADVRSAVSGEVGIPSPVSASASESHPQFLPQIVSVAYGEAVDYDSEAGCNAMATEVCVYAEETGDYFSANLACEKDPEHLDSQCDQGEEMSCEQEGSMPQISCVSSGDAAGFWEATYHPTGHLTEHDHSSPATDSALDLPAVPVIASVTFGEAVTELGDQSSPLLREEQEEAAHYTDEDLAEGDFGGEEHEGEADCQHAPSGWDEQVMAVPVPVLRDSSVQAEAGEPLCAQPVVQFGVDLSIVKQEVQDVNQCLVVSEHREQTQSSGGPSVCAESLPVETAGASDTVLHTHSGSDREILSPTCGMAERAHYVMSSISCSMSTPGTGDGIQNPITEEAVPVPSLVEVRSLAPLMSKSQPVIANQMSSKELKIQQQLQGISPVTPGIAKSNEKLSKRHVHGNKHGRHAGKSETVLSESLPVGAAGASDTVLHTHSGADKEILSPTCDMTDRAHNVMSSFSCSVSTPDTDDGKQSSVTEEIVPVPSLVEVRSLAPLMSKPQMSSEELKIQQQLQGMSPVTPGIAESNEQFSKRHVHGNKHRRHAGKSETVVSESTQVSACDGSFLSTDVPSVSHLLSLDLKSDNRAGTCDVLSPGENVPQASFTSSVRNSLHRRDASEKGQDAAFTTAEGMGVLCRTGFSDNSVPVTTDTTLDIKDAAVLTTESTQPCRDETVSTHHDIRDGILPETHSNLSVGRELHEIGSTQSSDKDTSKNPVQLSKVVASPICSHLPPGSAQSILKESTESQDSTPTDQTATCSAAKGLPPYGAPSSTGSTEVPATTARAEEGKDTWVRDHSQPASSETSTGQQLLSTIKKLLAVVADAANSGLPAKSVPQSGQDLAFASFSPAEMVDTADSHLKPHSLSCANVEFSSDQRHAADGDESRGDQTADTRTVATARSSSQSLTDVSNTGETCNIETREPVSDRTQIKWTKSKDKAQWKRKRRGSKSKNKVKKMSVMCVEADTSAAQTEAQEPSGVEQGGGEREEIPKRVTRSAKAQLRADQPESGGTQCVNMRVQRTDASELKSAGQQSLPETRTANGSDTNHVMSLPLTTTGHVVAVIESSDANLACHPDSSGDSQRLSAVGLSSCSMQGLKVEPQGAGSLSTRTVSSSEKSESVQQSAHQNMQQMKPNFDLHKMSLLLSGCQKMTQLTHLDTVSASPRLSSESNSHSIVKRSDTTLSSIAAGDEDRRKTRQKHKLDNMSCTASRGSKVSRLDRSIFSDLSAVLSDVSFQSLSSLTSSSPSPGHEDSTSREVPQAWSVSRDKTCGGGKFPRVTEDVKQGLVSRLRASLVSVKEGVDSGFTGHKTLTVNQSAIANAEFAGHKTLTVNQSVIADAWFAGLKKSTISQSVGSGDRAGADRTGADRAGAVRAGTERTEADRASADRAGADRAAADRASAVRAGTDRAEADRAGADRARAVRAGADRAGADRAGADRAGADRAGADRAGADRAGADRAGAERAGAADEGVAKRSFFDCLPQGLLKAWAQ